MMPTVCRDAVDILVNHFEANHIQIQTAVLEDQVMSWYTNSDIADACMLAAAVLQWGYWRQISFTDWLDAREYWFPQDNIFFSAAEYEASYHDADWRQQ